LERPAEKYAYADMSAERSMTFGLCFIEPLVNRTLVGKSVVGFMVVEDVDEPRSRQRRLNGQLPRNPMVLRRPEMIANMGGVSQGTANIR
jgi:hypothetical protein